MSVVVIAAVILLLSTLVRLFALTRFILNETPVEDLTRLGELLRGAFYSRVRVYLWLIKFLQLHHVVYHGTDSFVEQNRDSDKEMRQDRPTPVTLH